MQLTYWEKLVSDFFTQEAVMKFTLWKDNQRNEMKPFGPFLRSSRCFEIRYPDSGLMQRLVFLFYHGSFLSRLSQVSKL